MKFLVPNYSYLQNPWLGGYRPRIPVLSVLCPKLNLLNPPPEQNSWVRHCGEPTIYVTFVVSLTMSRELHGQYFKIGDDYSLQNTFHFIIYYHPVIRR